MIRKYKDGDHLSIGQIFHDAIYQLASEDYSGEQLDAWANPPINFDLWKDRCEKKKPFVNEIDGQVAGFIEFDPGEYPKEPFLALLNDVLQLGVGLAK